MILFPVYANSRHTFFFFILSIKSWHISVVGMDEVGPSNWQDPRSDQSDEEKRMFTLKVFCSAWRIKFLQLWWPYYEQAFTIISRQFKMKNDDCFNPFCLTHWNSLLGHLLWSHVDENGWNWEKTQTAEELCSGENVKWSEGRTHAREVNAWRRRCKSHEQSCCW